MSDQSEPRNINSWLQDELYTTYLHDKRNVDDSWKSVFEGSGNGQPSAAAVANGHAPQAPAPIAKPALQATAPAPGEELQAMRGVAAKIAENMTLSLTVPTATSQRIIAVRALEQARSGLNRQREAAGQGKLSFTHLIGWAIIQALKEFPRINDAFSDQNGEPARLVRKQINFGLAVDVKGKDGNSQLMVPNIKNAGAMTFPDFVAAFDDVVSRARNGKLQMPDFQGTTISLTNPGTVGTYGSAPRLVAGQGAIVATGAVDFPAEYSTVSEETRRSLGISKVMMMTCTYDHRIIQGAESGRFLGRLAALLGGEGAFYESLASDLGLLYRAPAGAVAAPKAAPVAAPASATDAIKEAAVAYLVDAYRVRGHLIADLDPLGSKRPMHPDLDPKTYGLTDDDLGRPFAALGGKTLAQILEELRHTYSSKIGVEYMYIESPEQKDWLRERMESTRNEWPIDSATKVRILERLMEAEQFESFLHTRYIGKKRFSMEGGEAAIVAMDELLERAANTGVQETFIGMAHRGRLTILANIVGKPLPQVFAEFDEAPDLSANAYGTGDVKYHLGAHGKRTSTQGKEITVSVAFNPSHLEAVDPVVEGMVRARQVQLGGAAGGKVLPILIHGDAAFAGQGVVFETLNLSQLEGYATGGTVHLIINNQVGFTTPPIEGRSGAYSSDIARSVQAPIFHVNGDDPEAVFRVTQLAYDFRKQFNRDVVIDMICYRKHGHNEGDDPTYTQPIMYKKIRAQRPVVDQYAERLANENVLPRAEFDAKRKAYIAKLSAGFDESKLTAATLEFQEDLPPVAEPIRATTAIGADDARKVVEAITSIPAGFHIHPKLKGFLDRRKEVLDGKPMDWAMGEAMAFGSLLINGRSVRLSGQDSGRGTFSQRHLELYDYEDGHRVTPLKSLESPAVRFEVYDSSLSEYAVMGFEFGFSLADPNTLVMWEGQFGDFVNGGQIIIDQFISSAETKWGQPSGLVLLLPHGYEGMGPEHSSARIERFLQLCAENNMQVANCTTPAQYFHILRRQMLGPDGKPIRKPLILFTPKSILRHPKAVSTLDDLTNGSTFHEVLDDPGVREPKKVERIILCWGKIYYELIAKRETLDANVAVVRVEQMYPFPQQALQDVLQKYPSRKEIYWVQEEPENMGAWLFVRANLQPMLSGKNDAKLAYQGRPERASPAEGRTKIHEEWQERILTNAFAAAPPAPKPTRKRVVSKKK